MRILRLIDRPEAIVERVEVGGGVVLLRTSDDRRILVEHTCAEWDDPYTGEHYVKIVAPRLHPDHVITDGPAGVTIRASILCPACGLHGFVTDGVWAGC